MGSSARGHEGHPARGRGVTTSRAGQWPDPHRPMDRGAARARPIRPPQPMLISVGNGDDRTPARPGPDNRRHPGQPGQPGFGKRGCHGTTETALPGPVPAGFCLSGYETSAVGAGGVGGGVGVSRPERTYATTTATITSGMTASPSEASSSVVSADFRTANSAPTPVSYTH